MLLLRNNNLIKFFNLIKLLSDVEKQKLVLIVEQFLYSYMLLLRNHNLIKFFNLINLLSDVEKQKNI